MLQHHLLCRHLRAIQFAEQIIIPDILTYLGPLTIFDAAFKSRVTIFIPYTLTCSRSASIIAISFLVASQSRTSTVRVVPTQIATRTQLSETTIPTPPPASIALCPLPGQRTTPSRTPRCALKMTVKPSRTCSETLTSSAATRTSKEAGLQVVRTSEHSRLVRYMAVCSTATFTTGASASTSPAIPSRRTRPIAILNLPRGLS